MGLKIIVTNKELFEIASFNKQFIIRIVLELSIQVNEEGVHVYCGSNTTEGPQIMATNKKELRVTSSFNKQFIYKDRLHT